MKHKMDPVVTHGKTYTRFRVQFWEYFTIALLESFADLCGRGRFGRIQSFNGCGVERMGKQYRFRWQPSTGLEITTGKVDLGAGYLILEGHLDFFTINRIRNFPLFHLRGLLGKRLGKRWNYDA